MFSLKALWTECNPHKAPVAQCVRYSNQIHHAEANTMSDSLNATQNKQGILRLQAFYLDQLDSPTAPMQTALAKGARLLAMTRSRATTYLSAGSKAA